MYAWASKQKMAKLKSLFDAKHVVAFNMRTSHWMQINEWTSEDVVGLILYCYFHNPLLLSNRAQYGNLDNVGQSIRMYLSWRRDNAELIASEGLCAAVAKAGHSNVPEGQRMTMEEVYEVYGKH